MAGYSGTPLNKKLGLKPGFRVLMRQAPQEVASVIERGAIDCQFLQRARTPVDLILMFNTRQAALDKTLPSCLKLMHAESTLWLAWPKKASGMATNLDFNVVQKAGLALGLVDNKICAVDDTWSGLRMVVRKQDRANWPR